MSERLSKQIDTHDLLEPSMVLQLLDELVTERNGLFTLKGSLADYRLEESGHLFNVRRVGSRFEFETTFGWPETFDADKQGKEKRRVRNSLMRAGIARPVNLSYAMTKLRQSDDVVIGIDTNILLDCTFSAHLLEEIYKERFPNWILVAVPKLVMAEIENKANAQIRRGEHPRVGWPTYDGRLGNRGLQELMSLDTKDADQPGLALMTVGELNESAADIAQKGNWLLDSEIRQQFHKFLSEISFHKGTYFLSQDRVNVMMSGTEGAEGLYLQKPELDNIDIDTLTLEELNQCIYELCVQFGEIELSQVGDAEITLTLSIFWPGKQVSDWRHSRLRLEEIYAPPW